MELLLGHWILTSAQLFREKIMRQFTMRASMICVFVAPPLFASCAAVGPITHEEVDFVSGTLMLAEVMAEYPKEKLLSDAKLNDWGAQTAKYHLNALRDVGASESDAQNAVALVIYTSCYGNNSRAGCIHRNVYLAGVDAGFQKKVTPRTSLRRGDIVEVKLDVTPGKMVIRTIVGIHRQYDAWKDCSYRGLGYVGPSQFSPFGPPVGEWLACDGLEDLGWVRFPRPSPPPGIFEWRKVPAMMQKQ